MDHPVSNGIEVPPVLQEILDSMETGIGQIWPDSLENKEYLDHVGMLETVESMGSWDHVVYLDQWVHQELLGLSEDKENVEQQ